MRDSKLLQPLQYTVVKGIFYQDDDDFNPHHHNLLDESFGLKDKAEDRWEKLKDHIDELNEDSDEFTSYKLIFIARHGEGWHNVAESFYGTPAWNEHWSKLTGNGTIVWGPDPELTPKGVRQAEHVNKSWKKEAEAHVPLPTSFYSSPLQRSSKTLEITWKNIQLKEGFIPLILEDLRETVGTHTCDQRSTKNEIAKRHPGWRFNEGFTEEDEIFRPPHEETDEHHDARSRKVLDRIFLGDPNACVSITAHSGTINSFFNVLHHNHIPIPTCGVVPMLIKAEGIPVLLETETEVEISTDASQKHWSEKNKPEVHIEL